MQAAHALGLALYSYANDNNGLYPDASSSTEAFQQLLDGGYISDPTILYVAMDGKTKASKDQKKLRPENVCWDITAGASKEDSGSLPLLFLTGYRITYTPGSDAVPEIKPFPAYRLNNSWFADLSNPGIAAYYVDNHAVWLLAQGNLIPHFVPQNFDAQGKTYRQLTPDGVLR